LIHFTYFEASSIDFSISMDNEKDEKLSDKPLPLGSSGSTDRKTATRSPTQLVEVFMLNNLRITWSKCLKH
jgi:hypothetical protein